MCALMLRTPQQCDITSVTSSAKNTWFSRFVSVFSCNVSFVWSVSITNFIITRICFSKISLRICNLKWICVFLYRALHVRQNESVSEHLQSLWSVHISPPFAIWRFHYQCLIWRRLLYSVTRPKERDCTKTFTKRVIDPHRIGDYIQAPSFWLHNGVLCTVTVRSMRVSLHFLARMGRLW